MTGQMEREVAQGCKCRWKEVMPGMWARGMAPEGVRCPVHNPGGDE